jgi:hypothetical protein
MSKRKSAIDKNQLADINPDQMRILRVASSNELDMLETVEEAAPLLVLYLAENPSIVHPFAERPLSSHPASPVIQTGRWLVMLVTVIVAVGGLAIAVSVATGSTVFAGTVIILAILLVIVMGAFILTGKSFDPQDTTGLLEKVMAALRFKRPLRAKESNEKIGMNSTRVG